MIKEELHKNIIAAFRDEPYVGDENIVYNNSEDHWDCYELKKQFLGVKWEDVSQKLMFENKDELPFFSSLGFKYYLPAFMLYIISDFRGSDTLADNLISELTLPQEIDYVEMVQNVKMHEIDKKIPDFDFESFISKRIESLDDNTKHFIEMAGLFNPDQKKAILAFLNYLNDNHADDYAYNPVKPIMAIERFWFQF